MNNIATDYRVYLGISSAKFMEFQDTPAKARKPNATAEELLDVIKTHFNCTTQELRSKCRAEHIRFPR